MAQSRRLSVRVPRLGENLHYHVYAAHSHKDGRDIADILKMLSDNGFMVNDPEYDFIPGISVLQNIVEKGIDDCRMTILFLTKNFLASNWCEYEANMAIWKYIKTKGKHRVIPVVLKPCAVPRYMKILNCVYAWKYQGTQLCHRLLKALTAPRLKYRRVRWIGIKTFQKGRDVVKKMRLGTSDGQASLSLLSMFTLVSLLDHCVLQCRHGRCRFICAGRNFLQFSKHTKICKYHPVRCQNRPCLHVCARWEYDTHQKSCPFKSVVCRNEGCGKNLVSHQTADHKEVCKFRIQPCPNKALGCLTVFQARHAKTHEKICEYETISCSKCGKKFLRMDSQCHVCENETESCDFCHQIFTCAELLLHWDVCPEYLVQCVHYPNCRDQVRRRDLGHHQKNCVFQPYKCQHLGCDFEDLMQNTEHHMHFCDFRLTPCENCHKYVIQKDLKRHQKDCHGSDLMTCRHCHVSFPRSQKPTHDNWICSKKSCLSICDICHQRVSYGELDKHKQVHYDNGDVKVSVEPRKNEQVAIKGAGALDIQGSNHGSWISTGVHKDEVFSSQSLQVVSASSTSPQAASKPRSHSDPEFSLESMVYILATEKSRPLPKLGARKKAETSPPEDEGYSSMKYRRQTNNPGSGIKKFRNLMHAIDHNAPQLSSLLGNIKNGHK